MEKACWTVIAALWVLLIGSSALASEASAVGQPVETRSNRLAVMSVATPAFPVAMPAGHLVSRSAIEAAQNNVIDPTGGRGGAEFFGTLSVAAVALWAARRRRII